MSQLLFVGEVMLLECRNLFEKLQATEKLIDTSEADALGSLSEAEGSLARLEQLHLSRSSSEGASLDSVIKSYSETVSELEALAAKDPWVNVHGLYCPAVVPAEPRVDALIEASFS
jgi:hypothetical protein